MELRVERYAFYNDTTLGVLYINNVFEAYTLEDKVREKKIPAETAIPAGKYDVVITDSEHFGRRMPLIKNVPGFDGIRIHSGNTKKDTKGCLLVGSRVEEKAIYDSRKAFNRLFGKLDEAQKNGEKITIEITSQSPEKKGTGKKIIAWTGAGLLTVLTAIGIRKLIKNRRNNEANN